MTDRKPPLTHEDLRQFSEDLTRYRTLNRRRLRLVFLRHQPVEEFLSLRLVGRQADLFAIDFYAVVSTLCVPPDFLGTSQVHATKGYTATFYWPKTR